uniref:Membrane protein n=1 Tax=Rhipicephalus appendiculatus TaxID=34631 RepID=A0A131Z3R5_RHIAP
MLRWCLLSAGKRLALLKPRCVPFHGQVRGDSTWKDYVKPFRKKTREEYARSDGLNPAQDLLVYTSGVHNYMLLASIAGTGAVAGVVCYAVYFYFNPWPEASTPNGRFVGKVTFTQKMTIASVLAMYTLGSFYFLRALPIRIYYNKSQQMFNLVFQGALPGLRRKQSFKPGALEPLYVDTDSIITPFLGTLRVKNGWQRLIVFEARFHRTAFYNVLVGYDSVDVLED